MLRDSINNNYAQLVNIFIYEKNTIKSNVLTEIIYTPPFCYSAPEGSPKKEHLMKKYLFSVLAVALSLFIIACNPDTPAPGESTDNNNSPASPATMAFSITEHQFTAEKAVLNGYTAIITNTGNIDTSEPGLTKVTSDIVSGSMTIKAGSYYKVSSSSPAARATASSSIEFKILAEENGNSCTVSFSGTTTNPQTLEDLTTDSFTIEEAGKTTSFASTPASLMCISNGDMLSKIVSEYIGGTRETADYEINNDESLYEESKNSGWIVFKSESIDNQWHKINFTWNGSNISSYTLDGWCEVADGNMEIAKAPAIKGENAKVSDEDAYTLAIQIFAFSRGVVPKYYNPSLRPEGVVFSETDYHITFTDKYVLTDFFAESTKIKGSMSMEGDAMLFDFSSFGDYADVVFSIGGDGSGSTIGGQVNEFTIGGASYMHLKDEIYCGCIRLFASIDYMMSLIYQIKDSTVSDYWKGEIKLTGNGCTFSEAKSYISGNGTVYTITGKIEITGTEFSSDFSITEAKEDNSFSQTIEIKNSGVLDNNDRPEYSEIDISNYGGVCPDFELNLINQIAASTTRDSLEGTFTNAEYA